MTKRFHIIFWIGLWAGVLLLSPLIHSSMAQDVPDPTSIPDELFAQIMALGAESDTHEEVILALIVLPTVLIAGISEAIGQCYVLFANRVRPFRFVLTIAINVLIFVAGFFVTVVSVWAVGRFIFDFDEAAMRALIAVSFSYQPLWFAFLSVLPYFGSYIVLFLYFLVYWQLSRTLITLDFTLAQAVASSALSLIIVFITRTTVGRPIIWLIQKIRNIAAGTRLERRVEDALRYHGDLIIDRPDEARP